MAPAVSVVSSTSRVRSKSRVTSLRRAIASARAILCGCRQIAGDDGDDEKREERDPVLRVGDRERAERREEEEVERQHRGERDDDRSPETGDRRGAEDHEQKRQRDRRRADVGQPSQHHRGRGQRQQAGDENGEISQRNTTHERSAHSDTRRIRGLPSPSSYRLFTPFLRSLDVS